MKIDLCSISYEEPSKPLPIGPDSEPYLRWYESRRQFEELSARSKTLEQEPPQYLRELIQLVEAEETKKKPRDDSEILNALYRFVIALQCPRLFFEKKVPACKRAVQESSTEAQDRQYRREVKKQRKGLSEYQAMQNKFTQNLRQDLHHYILCQTYIQRGTKDLNRTYVAPSAPGQPGGRRNLPLDELEQLRANIQQHYLYYYDRLVHSGYQVRKQPVVSERLTEHCCEKPWLIPMAHVLLLRDAQYQMMGHAKYTPATLLQEDSERFVLTRKKSATAEPVPVDPTISHEVAKGIQSVFIYYMNLHSNTTLTEGVLKGAETEPYYNPTSSLPFMSDFSSSLSSVRDSFYTLRAWSDSLFAIPDCDPDLLALRIGKARSFSTKQIDALREWLPMLLWQDCNIQNLLNHDPRFQHTHTDTIDTLTDILRCVKEFLNPERYYSYRTGKGEIRKSMIKAAEKLMEYHVITENGFDRQDHIQYAMASLIVAQNISDDILCMSHAVEPYTKNMYPAFLRYYIRTLRKQLRYYLRKKVILHVMGYSREDLGKDYKRYLKTSPAYMQVKQEMPGLEWTDAKAILKDLLCSKKGLAERQKDIERCLQKHCKNQLAYWLSDIRSEKKCLIYYILFSQLVESALHVLTDHSLHVLETLYQDYSSKKYRTEQKKWSDFKASASGQQDRVPAGPAEKVELAGGE